MLRPTQPYYRGSRMTAWPSVPRGFQGGARDRGFGTGRLGSRPGGSVSVCVWPHRRAKPRLLMAAMGAALRCPLSFSIWTQPLAGNKFRGGFGRLRFEGLVSSGGGGGGGREGGMVSRVPSDHHRRCRHFSGGCAAAHVVDNTHQERSTAPRVVKVAARWGLVMGRYATSTHGPSYQFQPDRRTSTGSGGCQSLARQGREDPRSRPSAGGAQLYGRPGRRSDTRFAMVGVPASPSVRAPQHSASASAGPSRKSRTAQ